jgi:hypothetical protein
MECAGCHRLGKVLGISIEFSAERLHRIEFEFA